MDSQEINFQQMTEQKPSIKQQIVAALSHPEADEGLFFRNFSHQHEVDERPVVEGKDADVLEALKELISEKKVSVTYFDDEPVFTLVKEH